MSFAWQVWIHITSGPRIKLEVSNSIIPDVQAPYDWLVCVTATNTGRSATTVVSWGFGAPDGGNVHQFERLPWSAALPTVSSPSPVLTSICQSQGSANPAPSEASLFQH